MDNNSICAQDLVDIVRGGDVDKNHEKLLETIKNMDRETVEALLIRMTYSLDVLTGE